MAHMQFKNDLFLRAFTDEKLPRPPIWLMRQAGRYLPEYRATRGKAGGFMDLCRSPSFCAEVLLQPLERYDLDAAILFSDILTVPDAMGLGLSFGVGEGPRFARPLRDEAAVTALAAPDMSTLQYVFDAVAECKRSLTTHGVQRVPLIGFSGSPFTLACYMIEGGGSADAFPLTRRIYRLYWQGSLASPTTSARDRKYLLRDRSSSDWHPLCPTPNSRTCDDHWPLGSNLSRCGGFTWSGDRRNQSHPTCPRPCSNAIPSTSSFCITCNNAPKQLLMVRYPAG